MIFIIFVLAEGGKLEKLISREEKKIDLLRLSD